MTKKTSQSKRALVTGGAGFIGSHLVDALTLMDWEVTVVDDLSANDFERPDWLNKKATYVFEDFASKNILTQVKNKSFDFVFHFAAKPSVPWSIENPLEAHKTNVFKTIQLLQACKGNIKRFIFSSSSAVYGNISSKSGASEDFDEPNPLSPYALQKLEIEQYLKLFKELYNFDYVALRYFNVYGPRQLGGSPYSNVISAWMYNCKNGLPCRLDGDGTQSRDFIFVTDVASANYVAATAILPDEERVFNVGSGQLKSCNWILKELKSQGLPISVENAPTRAGDVKSTLASTKKASKFLNWTSAVRLEDGLSKTIRWWKTYER